jgi:4-diphosphocytidyl-2-C-methyl-D-erythritol kinase
VLLDALWRGSSDRTELARVAAELGSDVPFFLNGGLGLGSGRGEQVTPLEDLPAHGVVVVSAGGPIGTGEVYRRLGRRLTENRAEANVWGLADRLRAGRGWDGARNDLEPVVLAGWPQVARVLEAVRDTGPLHAAVSGSGSAVFGVYQDVAAARRASAAMAGYGWVHVGTTLGRMQAQLVVEHEEGDG